MNVQFERCKNTTDEWYTPPELIRRLGEFDLDPATSEQAYRLNKSARKFYTQKDNGLIKKWRGRIWLNPPYSHPLIEHFMQKMAEHNNGIALIFNRSDSKWFQHYVFEHASAFLFIAGRIKFYRQDGTQAGTPGTGSVLAAYGKNNILPLQKSRINGHFIINITKS